MGAKITGIGHYAPETVITNQYFIDKGLDTTNEWIVERTGIHERRFSNQNEGSSELSFNAAIKCLKNAKLNPKDLDLIIVATSTPDHLSFPSTACILQSKLKCNTIPAFDLSAACSGFCFALSTAENYLLNDNYKNILVVGADCLSSITNHNDRKTAILFGDGAGAVILSKAESKKTGIIYSKMHSDGTYKDILKVPEGGSKFPINKDVTKKESHYIQMDGKAVFKSAINTTVPSIKEALKHVSLTANDISYLICHQANKRIIDNIAKKLNIESEKVIINLNKYGNTSAASIPLAMSEFNEKVGFKKGDILVLVGFGAGFTWGVNIIIWE
jgi:3-oxoacyl-[acyl-carrier-protein] synthase III